MYSSHQRKYDARNGHWLGNRCCLCMKAQRCSYHRNQTLVKQHFVQGQTVEQIEYLRQCDQRNHQKYAHKLGQALSHAQ
ncbi:MAG: hypothetical protein KME05_21630 [Gloeocapsa sp. UFS-A4-WI-NPMV-4B04]|nr:hypothetical protein [Gloeocapsa sp. UFS-A4-WI-NPMV-4B04]